MFIHLVLLTAADGLQHPQLCQEVAAFSSSTEHNSSESLGVACEQHSALSKCGLLS